jgi:hypothetical protein
LVVKQRIVVIEGNDADVDSWMLGTLESLESLLVYLQEDLEETVKARSWTRARSLLAQLERVHKHLLLLIRADSKESFATIEAYVEDDEPLVLPPIAERTSPEVCTKDYSHVCDAGVGHPNL